MSQKIVCFGEVLWDIFPDHKVIGGAPLNVALRLHALGNEVDMISRVGDDDLGKALLLFLQKNGLSTSFIQLDQEQPTGEVKVTLDPNGSASYEIMAPRAWDHIEVSAKEIELVTKADLFIFGSLSARNPITRQSLALLLEHARYRIFDVNLRAPHYTPELLAALMKKADLIKFNDEELMEIAGSSGCKASTLEESILFMSDKTGCRRICVTKGKDGALLLYDGLFYSNKGYTVKVADTVGAGDSFLATLIIYLSRHDPQEAVDHACAMGALVASHQGANPVISIAQIEGLLQKGH